VDALKEAAGLLTGIGALVGAVLAFLQYFKYTSRRDRMAAVRQAFDKVVVALASPNDVDRLAGAILLRRFFDPATEVTTKKTPYAAEAVGVIAAILRGQASGNFQKLLADGLAYAPSLRRADLQRTNLKGAYLGARGSTVVDLSGADFYRADLSEASLKGALAQKSVFYQARLHDTILAKADLRGAIFFQADLRGARFAGALLAGASFVDARNIPAEIAAHLRDEVWSGPETAPSPAADRPADAVRVFISKPGCLDGRRAASVAAVTAWLRAEGMAPQALERADYPSSGSLGEVQRIVAGCAGAIVFGFGELQVRDGVWRAGTRDEAPVVGQTFPTDWSQLEAGMAAMIGLPILVVAEPGLAAGIFDGRLGDHQIHRMPIDADRGSAPFADWCARVRERARAA